MLLHNRFWNNGKRGENAFHSITTSHETRVGYTHIADFIAHFVAPENRRNYKYLKGWSEWQDSNLRPLRPERSALPG